MNASCYACVSVAMIRLVATTSHLANEPSFGRPCAFGYLTIPVGSSSKPGDRGNGSDSLP